MILEKIQKGNELLTAQIACMERVYHNLGSNNMQRAMQICDKISMVWGSPRWG